MERKSVEGIVDAHFSVQPTEQEMKASNDEFEDILKQFNGDRNKAVKFSNEKHQIKADDIRKMAEDLLNQMLNDTQGTN